MIKKLLGEKLHFDRKIIWLTVVSTLLILIAYYYRITPFPHWESVILYFGIPMLIIIVVFREHPREYGLRLGDWKAGLVITFLGISLMGPVIWALGRYNAGMQGYYHRAVDGLVWKNALALAAWEFLFRGWLLFGYAEKYGTDALWLQAVPFSIAHLSKPDLETLSTIFGGFAFGWVAWRTKSVLYPFLIHWFIATAIIIVASGSH